MELSCQPGEAAFITWIEGIGPLGDIFEAAMGYCYVDFGFNSLKCFYTRDVQVWVRENSLSCWEDLFCQCPFLTYILGLHGIVRLGITNLEEKNAP